MSKGLFERWLEIERSSGRPMTEILGDINRVCGTKYRHNWPSKMTQSGYSMDRVPTGVRQYMMTKVLAQELQSRGLKLSSGEVLDLVLALT